MAFNPAPTQLIASWSENGTTIEFPIASLSELTAAEADAVTGDLRKVLFAFMERFEAYFSGLAVGDRPTKISITKNASPPSGGEYVMTYITRINIATGPVEVANE